MRLGGTEFAGCSPLASVGVVLAVPTNLPALQPPQGLERQAGKWWAGACFRDEKGCWVLAFSGWSTLFSETTFVASMMVEGSLGLSTPTPDAVGQFLGLVGGWDAGELRPSSSRPGLQTFLHSRRPSHPTPLLSLPKLGNEPLPQNLCGSGLALF